MLPSPTIAHRLLLPPRRKKIRRAGGSTHDKAKEFAWCTFLRLYELLLLSFQRIHNIRILCQIDCGLVNLSSTLLAMTRREKSIYDD